MRLIGPFFGLTPKFLKNHLGIRFTLDNRRSIEELGIRYRPAEQTLIDHYENWLKQKTA
ncbi:hypothetical protein [Parvibaculum sp.]|uniref:hypothetical protein n=1 Tax=Parvibaculum sp. TaxID=2024848 RepID=UPI002BD10FC0|nr:hypothetical protein [Parvibaculum sp.]HUD52042.1 hypothetical protein [Parvibaculum sp.]